MTLTEPLTLSPDVMLIDVADLPERARYEIGEDGAVAVTRARGRSSSVLIDEASAELLAEFQSPTTIADAVLRFSLRHKVDPQQTLTQCYPTLRRFLTGGYLLGAAAVEGKRREVLFAPGERVAGGTIVRCVRVLDDTEFYQLALDNGSLAALKVLKSSAPPAVALLQNEIDVLRLLDGSVSPRVLAEGVRDDNLWFCMEWCEGVPIARAAASLRTGRGLSPPLIELCRSTVEAYCLIHTAAVVHADVHPGNLLASGSGRVWVIDFGLSRLDGTAGASTRRGGVPPYYDPQYARAMLEGRRIPEADFLSDQYSLAAVLYLLLTGADYADFSIDRDEMLRQVAEDPPLPFTRRGTAAWLQMEELLRRALEKDPDKRFPAVESMKVHLDRVLKPASSPSPRLARPWALELMLQDVVAKSGPGGEWFENGVPQAPYCSIAYGAAGIAVGLLRVGILRSDPELVALADEWAVRAEREAGRREAFTSKAMDLDERRTGVTTPYHRRSGVAAVEALVALAMGDALAARRAIATFVEESRRPCENIDVTLGRAGTVLGAAILLEAARGDPDPADRALWGLGEEVLAGIWQELDAMPPIGRGAGINSLGVAHGWAGLLLATLRWCRVANRGLPGQLELRLDELADLAVPRGLGARWPWGVPPTGAVGRGRTMPGWCNGSAGFVHLWTTAHATLKSDKWALLAEQAAWDTYTTQTRIGQLCCGAAGQSYALLEMYRHSGESRWLSAALELGARAAAADRSRLIAGSLHKGDVGIAVLAADLAEPEMAMMPFFGAAG